MPHNNDIALIDNALPGHKSNYTFDVDGSLLSSSYIIQRGAGSCHISNRSLRMAVTTTKWNSDDESSIDKPVVAASKPSDGAEVATRVGFHD